MRKIIALLISLILILGLCACTKNTAAWQDQYNLGLRYLSEGNYNEAIIAFTAAIEIDPQISTVYIGRGDAYFALGTEDYIAFAIEDYNTVIDMDRKNVDAYIKLAEVYFSLGDETTAIMILENGCDITKDEHIIDRLKENGILYVYGMNAVLFPNVERYYEEFVEVTAEYQGVIIPCIAGISFDTAIPGLYGDEITEAELLFMDNSGLAENQLVIGDIFPLDNWENAYNWDYFEKSMVVCGYFAYNEDYQRFSLRYIDGAGKDVPELRPNGPYNFTLREWHFEQ